MNEKYTHWAVFSIVYTIDCAALAVALAAATGFTTQAAGELFVLTSVAWVTAPLVVVFDHPLWVWFVLGVHWVSWSYAYRKWYPSPPDDAGTETLA